MSEQLQTGQGSRKNSNKPRFDLLEWFAQLIKARIFTKGARKYAVHNWLQGMDWSKCVASALRHQAAFLRGEDYDYDPTCPDCQRSVLNGTMEEWHCANHTGELHSALAAWNWDAITSYYKHYPQGDDRLHVILPKVKIGLDIDEVLADFTSAWAKVHSVEERPECWNYHRGMSAEFKKMKEAGTLDDFYLSLQPKIKPNELPFEPHCYVTSRPVDTWVTEKWLEMHKFPGSKVITVPLGTSKAQVLKDNGVDIFVDDAFHNYDELNRAGICCFLMDAPHNRRYDVGYKRIKSLKELRY